MARAQASRLVETWARRTCDVFDLCSTVQGALIVRKFGADGGLVIEELGAGSSEKWADYTRTKSGKGNKAAREACGFGAIRLAVAMRAITGQGTTGQAMLQNAECRMQNAECKQASKQASSEAIRQAGRQAKREKEVRWRWNGMSESSGAAAL
ncbi:hypothetical protein WAI453_001503 [Rhynchosporium graminicola]